MMNPPKLRQLDLIEIKAILINPFQALALCALSGSSHITTNGQGSGLIEVIEEVTLLDSADETLREWINENIVHLGDEKTVENALCTAQYCDIWRDCYLTQPVSAAKKAVELGLVEKETA